MTLHEVTDDGVVIGAGILPYTFDKDGRLMFLLAKERLVPGWGGSNAWSAFEGGTKPTDRDLFHTAAREYIEESLGMLHAVVDRGTIPRIAEQLRLNEFSLRVTLRISSASASEIPRYHVTFVKYFDIDDTAVPKFDHRRAQLLQVVARTIDPFEHPAIDKDGRVNADFLEKSESRLWGATQLYTSMTRYRAHRLCTEDRPIFRTCFLRTLRVVLNEFALRVSE